MRDFMYYDPVRVLFGCGALGKLHEQKLPGKKALICISNGKSTIKNGSLDKLKAELDKAGCSYEVFNKIAANPLKAVVEEGAKFAEDSGCDFIVALGGGSVMDASKVIAMLAAQPSDDLWDYAGGITGKGLPIENDPLPFIAITTSAGTGSEVDTVGVITNPETNEKIGIGRVDCMFADLAIVDPELMKTVPPKFTAFQGFDALFHSLEGYISNKNSLMSDMIQRAAIENIGKYLPRAVADGSDMEAREAMAFANTMSGYSMVVTLLHIGTFYGTCHECLSSGSSARSRTDHAF
jgi:alcohol dehydrogenase